jgi:predicted SAM-dependent methyltransferase
VSDRTGWGYTSDLIRLHFSRHLRGRGIELGPGHHPYVTVLPGTEVRYVDRWVPQANRALFPELGDEAVFPEPDIVANLDEQLLEMLPDRSEDFVITSHVLEHLANPMAMLADCHRVLRPGGVLVVLLPDMTMTSDSGRKPTSLDHLVHEYDTKVRAVDDAHVLEYIRVVRRFDGEGPELAERMEKERSRSFHVHCWTESTFFPVLEYAVGQLDCGLELVEFVLPQDIKGSKEFGYVLRRPVIDATAEQNRARLVAARDLMLKTRFAQSDPAVAAKLAAATAPPAWRKHPAVRAARKTQLKLVQQAKGLRPRRD